MAVNGSTIAVVGSNGAIGAAVVEDLLANGVQVLGFDRGDVARDPRVVHHALDFADLDVGTAGFRTAVEDHRDTLSGLVIASGLYPARHMADETPQTLADLLLVNTVAPAVLVEAYVAGILGTASAAPRPQSIVVTSSLAARKARIGSGAYSASKIALERLVTTTALEHLGTGIRINCVQPGYVSSHSEISPIPADYEEMIARRSGGLVVPADLVGIYRWLLSDASALVNGECLAIDGGLHIGRTDDSAWVDDGHR